MTAEKHWPTRVRYLSTSEVEQKGWDILIDETCVPVIVHPHDIIHYAYSPLRDLWYVSASTRTFCELGDMLTQTEYKWPEPPDDLTPYVLSPSATRHFLTEWIETVEKLTGVLLVIRPDQPFESRWTDYIRGIEVKSGKLIDIPRFRFSWRTPEEAAKQIAAQRMRNRMMGYAESDVPQVEKGSMFAITDWRMIVRKHIASIEKLVDRRVREHVRQAGQSPCSSADHHVQPEQGSLFG